LRVTEHICAAKSDKRSNEVQIGRSLQVKSRFGAAKKKRNMRRCHPNEETRRKEGRKKEVVSVGVTTPVRWSPKVMKYSN